MSEPMPDYPDALRTVAAYINRDILPRKEWAGCLIEAAATIDAKDARIAELEAALWPFAKTFDAYQAMARMTGGDTPKPSHTVASVGGAASFQLRWRDFDKARATLKGKP